MSDLLRIVTQTVLAFVFVVSRPSGPPVGCKRKDLVLRSRATRVPSSEMPVPAIARFAIAASPKTAHGSSRCSRSQSYPCPQDTCVRLTKLPGECRPRQVQTKNPSPPAQTCCDYHLLSEKVTLLRGSLAGLSPLSAGTSPSGRRTVRPNLRTGSSPSGPASLRPGVSQPTDRMSPATAIPLLRPPMARPTQLPSCAGL